MRRLLEVSFAIRVARRFRRLQCQTHTHGVLIFDETKSHQQRDEQGSGHCDCETQHFGRLLNAEKLVN